MTLLTLKNHDQIAKLQIPSGVRPDEGKRLAYLTSQVPKPGVIVEIGACRGRSTAYIASAIRECASKAVFYSIDVWELGAKFGTPKRHHSNNPFQEYKENLEKLGVFQYVIPLKCNSSTASGFIRVRNGIDLLFIDGDHRYEGVKDDYLKWSVFIRPGGMIAFHDYKTAHIGVTQAIDELITEKQWEDFQLVDTLFTAKRKA